MVDTTKEANVITMEIKNSKDNRPLDVDVTMIEGDYLESKIDDRELVNLNGEHIVNICRRDNFDAVPME
jgi:hypothetical protein